MARNLFRVCVWSVVLIAASARLTTAADKVRIVQTNSAGDNVHLIDPATNRVVGEIRGVEVSHGVAGSPDGRRIYLSNEADSTLDVVDAASLKVIKKVPLSGHPNNIAIGKDGRRVFVGIAQAPGAVDIIDTASMTKAKTVAGTGPIHNVYVTPDGKYAVSGSIPNKVVTAIDTKTEQIAWTMEFDLGIRPMTFSKNPDGSTKWLFVQLTNLHGFAVVDFNTRKELKRVTLPALRPGRESVPEGSDASHGMAVTPDQKILLVNSRLNNAVYSYALPDLKLLGEADLTGKGAAWVTLTPDGKTAYIANAVTNDVSVVDVQSMKETTKIAVGFVPKRNATITLP